MTLGWGKKIFFVVLLNKNLNTDFNNRPPPSLPSRRIPFMVGRVGGHIVVTRFVKNAVFFLNWLKNDVIFSLKLRFCSGPCIRCSAGICRVIQSSLTLGLKRKHGIYTRGSVNPYAQLMGRYNSDLCKAFDYFSNFVGDMLFKVNRWDFSLSLLDLRECGIY